MQETEVQFSFPDTDGDGIDDRWDSCIDEPENFDGYLDWDGCPDVTGADPNIPPDADYDGIPDAEDDCPDRRENYNKFEDDDGCPDTLNLYSFGDYDFDTIPDNVDRCPYAAENYNRYMDTDGCPDVARSPERRMRTQTATAF